MGYIGEAVGESLGFITLLLFLLWSDGCAAAFGTWVMTMPAATHDDL